MCFLLAAMVMLTLSDFLDSNEESSEETLTILAPLALTIFVTLTFATNSISARYTTT